MKRLFWLIALLILVIPATAQDNSDLITTMPIGAVDVTKVILTRAEDNTLSLTIYGNPVTCDAPTVAQTRHTITFQDEAGVPLNEGTLIDVLLTTDPAPEGVTCNFFVPFSHTVTLDGTFETDQTYILTINNFTAWVFLVRPGQVVMDMEVQQVDLGETELMGWLNSDLITDNVDWDIASGEYVATITGNLPDGCTGSLISYTVQDSLNPDLYHVEVFRVLPLAVMCPAILKPFTAIVATNITATPDTMLAVGTMLYTGTETSALTAIMQRPISIETVSISGSDGAYQVQILGTQNGNCGTPLQEISGAVASVSVIEIFDLVTEATPCTKNLIPYDNTFAVAQMPVVVNDSVYFADDSGSNLPVEGNIMQVDTVIENVEVAILESFPMQLNLTVTGYHPDGCDFPVQVIQQRAENTVNVHIYREVPADAMCTMNIVGYEDTIMLEGGFTGGTVTINVNDHTVTVAL